MQDSKSQYRKIDVLKGKDTGLRGGCREEHHLRPL
jgi:hypothetical protein